MAKIWQQNAHRSGHYEFEERVQFTVGLLRSMTHKHEVKRKLKDEFGVEFRQAERYIGAARARILLESTENHLQVGAVLQDKLSEIIGSNTSDANKIRAIEVFAKILGLNSVNVNQTVSMSSGSELDIRRQRIVEALTQLKSQVQVNPDIQAIEASDEEVDDEQDDERTGNFLDGSQHLAG